MTDQPELGTARITAERASDLAPGVYWVEYTNVGSFLRNERRGFSTLDEAVEFCRGRNLRIRVQPAN